MNTLNVKPGQAGADTLGDRRPPAQPPHPGRPWSRIPMDDLDGPHTETTVTDLIARRPEVLRRLLERGVPAQTIQLLFPDWDGVLAAALSEMAPTTG